MYNSNVPSDRELPSTKKLIRSTIFAAIVAGLLLVTVVMPAEYGIDPSGIGQAIGLKRMGEIKVSLSEEAAAERAKEIGARTYSEPQAAENLSITPAPAQPSNITRSDEMQITLAPDEGKEIKLIMSKGHKVEYTWSTNGGKANYDAHGDSNVLGIDYHNYSKGSKEKQQGVIEAAFDGSHGWFWRNRTSSDITVTLQTSGEYTDIKRVQ